MTYVHSAEPGTSASVDAGPPSLPHVAGERISIRQLRLGEIDGALELTQRHPDLSIGSGDVLKRVHAFNGDTTWGVFVSQDHSGEPVLAGYYAFLLLNERGAAALLDRSLDRKNPPLEYIVKPGERPHIVYIWVIVAKGLSAHATPRVVRALGAQNCAGAPLFAGAGTQSGLNLMRRQGFTPVTPDDNDIGGLFIFGKLGDLKVRPLKALRQESRLKVIVARTSEDVERALAIRAAVFMIEQNCPYDEEFDGNDRSCTHLLGYVDGEPAAAIRIRYFADFVKLERLAVLPRFRGVLIAREIVQSAIDFCRRKGYRKMYGHGQKRLLNFWARHGFKPMDKNYALVFSDHEYVEISCDLEPHDDPITMYSDPRVFLRPEGLWDRPGILEKSAERPPTNPH